MPSTRAGRLKVQPGGYTAFLPEPVPPSDLRVGAELQALLSKADIALGRLDGVVEVVPDPGLFLAMYVRREAVLSTQIEGTDASLMDVLEYEAVPQRPPSVDVREVINYVRAMDHGIARLDTLPLGRRLLCEVHEVLMRDVRGGDPSKTPGEFRRSQNWIGGPSPSTARFVPPPAEALDDAFGQLEMFLHDPTPMPPLIKVGIAHGQFETIHPFLDGNGRTGRLLITFWLVEQGILRRPLLYPSLHLKEHRDEYVSRLQAIRDERDWEGWLAFFVDAMAQAATQAGDRARDMVVLRERDRARIASTMGRRAATAQKLLDELFRRPLIVAKNVESMLGISQPTASSLVAGLEAMGILRETTGKSRYRIFAYDEYLSLFPGAESRR